MNLHEKRESLRDQMTKIVELCEREGRNLRPHEKTKFDELKTELDGLQEVRGKREISPYAGSGTTRKSAAAKLGREERMADWAAEQPSDGEFTTRDADDFSIGNIMRAMVQPEFRSELTDVETRALAKGTNSAGGFITPEILSVNVIDRVRNNMAVVKAGATTVPLNSDQQSIPRLSGGVTGAWRNENSAFATTQPTFDRVTFTPQSYGFLVLTSEELYQDMVPGGGRILEQEFTSAAALELDRAALRGTGTTPEPLGVRNQPGVTIQSLATNGLAPSYDALMTSVTTLQTANREPSGVILSPRSQGTLSSLKDSTGQPLNPPKPVADLPRYVTGQIPNNLTQGSSSVASEIYVGDWSDLLIGIRLGVQLRLLTERYADTGQYAWRIFMRMDVQLAHPESFVVQTGAL